MVLCGLVLFIGIAVVKHSHRNTAKSDVVSKSLIDAEQMQQASQNNQVINGLQTKLEQIKQDLSQSHDSSSQNIQQLKVQITDLEQSFAEIEQNAKDAKLAAQQSNKSSQQNYIEATKHAIKVESQLNAIHKQLTPPKYLPESVLPFKAVGLDYWNGKPMVTVAMKDVNGSMHYRLLGKNMLFAGWKLRELITEKRAAIFTNSKNRKVKVEL